MRSVVVGAMGLFLAASAFGNSREVARGKQVLENINGLASSALSEAANYKYKVAGLCKFIGQLIPDHEEAATLSEKLQKQDAKLSDTLMRASSLIYVAEVDICTAMGTYGQPQGYDKGTEDKDANTLEQNFVDLVKVTTLK